MPCRLYQSHQIFSIRGPPPSSISRVMVPLNPTPFTCVCVFVRPCEVTVGPVLPPGASWSRQYCRRSLFGKDSGHVAVRQTKPQSPSDHGGATMDMGEWRWWASRRVDRFVSFIWSPPFHLQRLMRQLWRGTTRPEPLPAPPETPPNGPGRGLGWRRQTRHPWRRDLGTKSACKTSME